MFYSLRIPGWVWLILWIALIAALFNSCFGELQRKFPSFEVGAIVDSGRIDPYAEKTIYSAKKLECYNFEISRPLDKNWTVRVYYFNDKDELLFVEECAGESLIVEEQDMIVGTKYIRVGVTSEEGFSDWDIFWMSWSLKIKTSNKNNVFVKPSRNPYDNTHGGTGGSWDEATDPDDFLAPEPTDDDPFGW